MVPPDHLAKAACQMLDELAQAAGRYVYSYKDIADLPATAAILGASPEAQMAVVREGIDRIAAMRQTLGKPQDLDPRYMNLNHATTFPRAALQIVGRLLRRKLPWTEADIVYLVNRTADLEMVPAFRLPYLPLLVAVVEREMATNGLTDDLHVALQRLREAVGRSGGRADEQRLCSEITHLCQTPQPVDLERGEAWSDQVLDDLENMKFKQRKPWLGLLIHCQKGGSGKLTLRWQREAEPLIAEVGWAEFKEHLLRWFPLVDKPRTQPLEFHERWDLHDENLILPAHVKMLRGLAWCAGLREDADLARVLTRLALSAYRKIPGKGPRLVSLGNACVTALSMMPGLPPIGQLAILKVKVKFGTAQKEIEKAFNAAAARENLPREDIEELAVPSYGLEEVGQLRRSFGEYQAELNVDGSSAAMHWLKQDKPIKSVPAAVKTEHAAELKESQTAVKDINSMLPVQRERLDTLFLSRKTWPLSVWRERYLDHPLVGTIARRLIWSFTAKGRTIDGCWHDGKLVGSDGKPLDLKDEATVSLWHPIGHTMEEVLAWRDWLERREVIQPFKQAHREVYLLTDAERRTRTYSNRFAAHVLRQHQFHALCAARGWKNKLRLLVDDSYPPAHRLLPAWGLRAEYWIEGAGDDYGRDTNEAGAFLYLTTDQVRFYALDAPQLHAHAGGGGYGRWGGESDEPLPLETIPPLVFSEILRDVDLFVGVASVGNDPNWSDGGPEGRYRDYWQSYSFGELSATAQTRRALLGRLLPRLKIADRCSLSERFLHVRGDLRGYKIHLGSGNILMTPNDQYLCIVPKQATAGHERVFLPFEGDATLSVILSKAFLLAEDTNITDPSIVSQIKR